MKVRQTLYYLSIWVAIPLVVLSGCADQSEYVTGIDEWHSARIERLRQPMGWLSLAGRIEVPVGTSSFGSAAAIRFPSHAPDTLGFLTHDSTGVVMRIDDAVTVTDDNGNRYVSGRIDFDDPVTVHYEAFYWTFIERTGHVFLRLWDTLAVERSQMHGIDRYPVDDAWNVEARFTPAAAGASMVLDDVTGAKREVAIEGTCDFMLGSESISLLALDGGPEDLFLIFEDLTTDVETYGGGRYLYCARPDNSGKVIIDFNKAYNPPCAFTEFATCLLAPPENRLGIPINAGEKKYGSH